MKVLHWINRRGISGVLAVLLLVLGLTGCGERAGLALNNSENLPSLGWPDLLTIGTNQNQFSYRSGRNQKLAQLAERYEKTISKMDDEGMKENYLESLVEYYDQLGYREKAIAYLQRLQQSSNPYVRDNAGKRLARIYYQSREFSKGIELLEQVESSEVENHDPEILLLKGNLLCGLGASERGRAAYQEALAMAEEVSEGVAYIQEQVEERLDRIQLYQGEKVVTIQGKVTAQGQPLPHVRVGLILGENQGFGWGPGRDKLAFVEVTDQTGDYSFANLPVGDYQIYIQVDQSRVGFQYVKMLWNGETWGDQQVGSQPGVNQFDFALVSPVTLIAPANHTQVTTPKVQLLWEGYPGAAYYQISFNEIERDQAGEIWSRSTITVLGERAETNQLDYDLTKLDQPVGENSYSSRSLELTQILGHLYPGAEIGWVVKAYDEQGQLLSISSPQGCPLDQGWYLTIDFGELQPGDAELIDHRYFAALDRYLDQLAEDPLPSTQEKVRRMIDGMSYLYRYDYDDQFDDAAYLRVTQRGYELMPEYDLAKLLGDLLFDQKRYDEARQVYRQAMELQSGSHLNELNRALAEVEFQLGNYRQAGEYWSLAGAPGYQLAYQILTGLEVDLGTEWQELERTLGHIEEKLDQLKLQEFRQALLAGQSVQVEQILQGNDLTSRYLHLCWQLISTRRIWDQYELRQQLTVESRELAELISLSQEEEAAWQRFVHLWI